jgi:hypothetical protein
MVEGESWIALIPVLKGLFVPVIYEPLKCHPRECKEYGPCLLHPVSLACLTIVGIKRTNGKP